ncbi:hypothetical protein HW555_008190 [Spodoptera exigua]|uniref:Uncharacterized protein n=1 Tax=Spodoptera exigua TaxID=7107 RepID=A0A835GFP8_SPOEX|nr:hypothetical protein HW555_008190 [Spodoptera exigua]
MAMSNEQFQQLLSTITANKRGTFASCTFTYDGKKNSDAVEAFLAAATVFKSTEKISDSDALQSLPLLLRDEAAVWWQGVKTGVTQWEDFCTKLRHTFAPRKPTFMVYYQITHEVQEANVTTEAFIARKRSLFSLAPPPAFTESQQIDLIFPLIRLDIRNRMPRDTLPTFYQLLETARGIEETLHEYAASSETGETGNAPGKKVKIRCTFCKNLGHTADVCRKKKRAEGTLSASVKDVSEGQTQAPSPSQPKFSCYGCGAPGVYRSNCSTCKKSSSPVKKENVAFCAVDAPEETQSRPVVFVEVDGQKGTAFMDTCAKVSVASYSLYQSLLKSGCKFIEKTVDLTLADGIKKEQVVLVCKAVVNLNGRNIATRFIVLQEARDNRTLLGVDFLQKAGVVINMPQYTWSFIDEPDLHYELYPEEFTIFESTIIKEMMTLPSPLSAMTVTDSEDTASVCNAMPTPPSTPPPAIMTAGEPETPTEDQQGITDYKLALIDLTSTPPSKKKPRLFDGYSPSFTDFMMRDAQINVHRENAELSPQSNSLFDANNWDVRIDSIDVVAHITPDQDKLVNQLLEKNNDVFNTKREPTKLIEQTIKTVDDKPISEHGEERRKKYVDKQRREDRGYNPGELVLATTHTLSNASRGVSNKFTPRRDGPYIIKKRHGPSSCEIADPQKADVVIGVYHSSALTPYVGESPMLPAPVQPLRKRGRPRKQILEHGSETGRTQKRGRPRNTPPLAGSSSGRLQIQRGRLGCPHRAPPLPAGDYKTRPPPCAQPVFTALSDRSNLSGDSTENQSYASTRTGIHSLYCSSL